MEAELGIGFFLRTSRQQHNIKGEDQSSDSSRISKSETACVPQPVVLPDK
jgi:hypothetical protein